jgi:hypothetical protein
MNRIAANLKERGVNSGTKRQMVKRKMIRENSE